MAFSFSADAFGSFGFLDGKLFNDEVNFDRDWIDDARRYFCNIVGKYGPFVQHLLKKAATVPIKMFCPLHGPVWRTDLGYFIDKHDKWSRYEPKKRASLLSMRQCTAIQRRQLKSLRARFVKKA